MTQIGTVELIAKIDTSRYKASAKEIDKVNKDIEKSTDNATSKSDKSWLKTGALVGAVAGAMQVAVTKAFSIISSSIGSAVQRIDTLNNFPKIMGNLGYATDESTVAIKNLEKGVLGLPTSLSDIASAMQNIAPSTKSLDEATKLTLALNNALLAGGKPMAMQATAMEQFSQAISKGKPDMMEWRTLATAMPGQLNQITQSLGYGSGQWQKMASDVSDGVLPFSKVTDAIVRLNEKGLGEFPSFAEQAKNATGGIQTGMANMQTAITRGLAKIIKAVGSENISSWLGNVGKGFELAVIALLNFVPKVTDLGRKVGNYLNPKLEALWNSIKDVIPVLKEFANKVIVPLAKALGVALVVALGLVIDQWNILFKVLKPVMGWLADNEQVVWGVVGAFLAFKGAMMIKDAYNTAKDGVKRISDAFGVLKSGISTARDMFGTMKDAVVDSAQMIAHAVKVGAAWVLEAGKASAAWIAHMAKILASMIWHAPKMILHAVDVGLAWTINAARASFVWVTTELPKIVAGMAKTAFWAVVHATATSAAWISSATRSAIAWVTTQLPRIVIGFAVTSTSAVLHAGISSAAWIFASSKSAIAWVVTQLPRIVAAFAVTSASAIVNATIASGAWIGAAVSSTQSWVALRALVSTPLVMPALLVGAAIASILLVLAAIKSVMDALNAMNASARASESAARSATDVRNRLLELERSGTTEQRIRASNTLRAQGVGGYSSGGFTGLGDKYDVAGIVHKGEFVFPKEAVDQSTGLPKDAGSNITINISGTFATSPTERRKVAEQIVDAFNQAQRAKGIAQLGTA